MYHFVVQCHTISSSPFFLKTLKKRPILWFGIRPWSCWNSWTIKNEEKNFFQKKTKNREKNLWCTVYFSFFFQLLPVYFDFQLENYLRRIFLLVPIAQQPAVAKLLHNALLLIQPRKHLFYYNEGKALKNIVLIELKPREIPVNTNTSLISAPLQRNSILLSAFKYPNATYVKLAKRY